MKKLCQIKLVGKYQLKVQLNEMKWTKLFSSRELKDKDY